MTERSDVYGLGSLMYALLTGQPPTTGRDLPEILSRVLSLHPPRRIAEFQTHVSPALEAVVFRCLEKEPSLRFASMCEVADALRRLSFANLGG